jgi:hypothetical protein
MFGMKLDKWLAKFGGLEGNFGGHFDPCDIIYSLCQSGGKIFLKNIKVLRDWFHRAILSKFFSSPLFSLLYLL